MSGVEMSGIDKKERKGFRLPKERKYTLYT